MQQHEKEKTGLLWSLRDCTDLNIQAIKPLVEKIKQLVLWVYVWQDFLQDKRTIKTLQHDLRSVDSHFDHHFISCWCVSLSVRVCVLQHHVIRTVYSSPCWRVRTPALLEPTDMFLSIPPSATQHPGAQRQRQTNTPVSMPTVTVNQAVYHQS